MNCLLVLTFADKPLPARNYLKKSCEAMGIRHKVLISSPWVQNVIKLKMLFEYVSDCDPEDVLLVVDAYDVVVFQDEPSILAEFKKLDADVVFSGESNFMYKEPAKWLRMLRKYPRQRTIFQFLNSGSYIGKASSIQQMLQEMQELFQIDLSNEKKLLPLKSDQYLLSRFYVESAGFPSALRLKIDAMHRLLGVTGGRFCVVNFPDLNRWQAFLHFILERNILKMFRLHKHQRIPKDYRAKGEVFYNKRTNTSPAIMHFPGTWDRFDVVYDDLLQNKVASKNGSWVFAFLISFVAFPISIIAAPILWLVLRRIN